MMSYDDVVREGTEKLRKAGIHDASIDAFYLFEYIFQISRLDYLLNKQKTIDNELYNKYISAINKRTSHVPLQHIIGCQEFMGLPFCVNENVLIPRQDTEVLVEEILFHAKEKSILDMCTGSGCIICSLAKLGNVKQAVGVDISEKALEIAAQNIKNLDVDVLLIQSDLFEHVEGRYDIIVSNPPYIESCEISKLDPEVRFHEPIIALDGMEDGLYFYREIIKHAPDYLTDNGKLFFEIGYNQGNAVMDLLENAGFSQIKLSKDLAGKDRVVSGVIIR